MAKVPRSVLKEYFGIGDKPTSLQFGLTLDSMVNFVDDRDLVGLRTYNENYDYLPGDCAVFNDQVVKCITATTGPFNPAHWTVLAAFGSVVYAGTWDTQNNIPALTSSVGTKGFYYVVVNASPDPNLNTELNGIDDWGTGDWAIFNGSIWEKVDNTEAPVPASNVSFNPTASISSTNVQDAIEEVDAQQTAAVDTKVSKAGDTMTGLLILSGNPTAAMEAVTKLYCDTLYQQAETEILERVNRTGDTMTGELILSGDPTPALAAVPKQYVDGGDAALQTQVNAKVNRAGDTMTGDLILNADPTNILGAVTKQYVDAINATLTTQVAAKVNRSGDTMTGDLILNADPTVALGAVTKQYTDTGLNAKVDVTGDTMLGDLILNADPTVALGAATKQYVDTADTSLQSQINTKVNRSGDTMTGDLILNADPTAALGAATKQYVDAGDALKLNLSGGTLTGNLILNADPTAALGAATKQYVDTTDTSLQSQINTKVNRSGDTMTGDLILNADPTVALGAVTKQYVDAINTALTAAKVSKSGDTMTGLLTLSGDPTAAMNASTKNYTDTQDALKVSKAGDTMTGLLTLSGDPTSALHASTKQYVDARTQKFVVPITFANEYAVSGSDFVRIPLQVVIPSAASVFAAATQITALLCVDYRTQNGSPNAEGEAAITIWDGLMSGVPTAVSGSTVALPASNDLWVRVTASTPFTLTESTTYQVIFRKSAGQAGTRVRIEAASLILFYS